MKAWRFYAIGDMRLDDIPMPVPEAGWVMIKTRVMQPSVTEAIRAKGGQTAAADLIKRRIEQEAPVQLFGHEFCGEVAELGEGVTSVKVGDRVSARTTRPCRKCELCKAGYESRCRKGTTLGRQIGGAMAEYFVVPAELLVKLPDSVSDSEGATIQPLGSCASDVADAGIRVADTVVVMGQGVMGLNIMQLARINGAGVVIGVDVRKTSLRLSKELGSDYQVDGSEVDPVEAIRDLTHGLGADIVFDCAGGSPADGLAGFKALQQAMEIVTDGGKIMQVAHYGASFEFSPDWLRKRSITFATPNTGSAKALEYAVRKVANGQVKVKPYVTHVLQGIEKMPEAFEITTSKAKFDAVNPAQVVVSQ